MTNKMINKLKAIANMKYVMAFANIRPVILIAVFLVNIPLLITNHYFWVLGLGVSSIVLGVASIALDLINLRDRGTK
jgi:hypothetical protein